MMYIGFTGAELSAEDKKSVTDIIIEYVMGKISRKEWKPGTRIPIELELVETLGISRNSAREAVKVLIALNLLEVCRANGTYVINHFSEKMMTPWACGLLLEDDDSFILLELHMVVERGIFSPTIQKDTEEDMRAIYDASEHLIVLAQDVQATSSGILGANTRYRERICEASHNHPTARLNDVIAFASLRSREKSIEEIIACNGRFHIVDSHRKLIEIIVQRRTVDLNEVLNYYYRYWGIAPQSQEQKNSQSTVWPAIQKTQDGRFLRERLLKSYYLNIRR